MATALGLLGVVLALFAAAVVATRDEPLLAPAPQELPDLDLPDGRDVVDDERHRPLSATDVREVRFSLAPRGYRMAEVDAVLDRLAEELAERDRRLAALAARADDEERGQAGG